MIIRVEQISSNFRKSKKFASAWRRKVGLLAKPPNHISEIVRNKKSEKSFSTRANKFRVHWSSSLHQVPAIWTRFPKLKLAQNSSWNFEDEKYLERAGIEPTSLRTFADRHKANGWDMKSLNFFSLIVFLFFLICMRTLSIRCLQEVYCERHHHQAHFRTLHPTIKPWVNPRAFADFWERKEILRQLSP